MTEPVVLPMIPEPVAIKEAYQRGEITLDEVIALICGSDTDAEPLPLPSAD